MSRRMSSPLMYAVPPLGGRKPVQTQTGVSNEQQLFEAEEACKVTR